MSSKFKQRSYLKLLLPFTLLVHSLAKQPYLLNKDNEHSYPREQQPPLIDDLILEDLGEDNFYWSSQNELNVDLNTIQGDLDDVDETTEWTENDPFLMDELKKGIKKDKKYEKYYGNRLKSPQEPHFYEAYLRNMTSNSYFRTQDPTCPQTELYVKIFQVDSGSTFSSLNVSDLEIRDSDRSVFFTGTFLPQTYVQSFSYRYCFLLRMNATGDYKYGAILTSGTNRYAECNALSLSEDDHVVAVGTFYDQVKTCALIVYTDQYFQNQLVKTWSQSSVGAGAAYKQEAWDVSLTADGSIYVTGFVTGWSNAFGTNVNDCFILKMDSQLNKVFVKSIGTNLEERCKSIQVTRNQDYIYLGGHQRYNGNQYALFFLKMDGYAQTVYYSQYLKPQNNQDFHLKRIILLNPRDAFTFPTPGGTSVGNADSNNQVYFCGTFTTSTPHQLFVFGQLNSQLTLTYMFSYGHPYLYDYSQGYSISSNNAGGDCDITPDGRFMVGTFATSSQRHSYSQIQNSYTVVATSQYNAYFQGCNNPGCGSLCNPICLGFANFDIVLSTAEENNVYTSCMNSLYSSITSYLNDYNQNIYSWTSCNYYTFNYNTIDCNIDLRFPFCNKFGADTCCGVACQTNNFQNVMNANKPWFRNYHDGADPLTGTWAGDQEFMDYQFRDYLCPSYSKGLWEQYWFCTQNTNAWGNGNWDTFNFVLEQDCIQGTVYTDFFIFKIDLTLITSNPDDQPVNAVYFGEKDGNEYPYAIGVDEFGFIVVAGTTDSANFGVQTWNSNKGMLYVKTHWDLNYEVTNGEANTGVSPQVTSLTYLGKRFVTPKFYTNKEYYLNSYQTTATTADTINNGATSLTSQSLVFMINLYTTGGACTNAGGSSYMFCSTLTSTYVYPNSDGRYQNWIPFAINEIATSITAGVDYGYASYTTPTFFNGGTSHVTNYGTGYSTIAWPYTYNLVKGNSIQINFPAYCLQDGSNKWYDYRRFKWTLGTSGNYVISGLTITNNTSSGTSGTTFGNFLLGTGTSTNSQGIYYLDDYQVGVKSVNYFCESTSTPPPNYSGYTTPYPKVQCFHRDFYNYEDDIDYVSMRRFNFGVRLKFVVDDTTLDPPTIVKDIPSLTVTAGLGLNYNSATYLSLTPITNYFSACNYLKAKQVPYTSGDSITQTTMLPYWIVFYDYNQTFVVEPPYAAGAVNPTINIQLICCNMIDECVNNVFSISVTNTIPDTVTFPTTSFILQYNTLANAGQTFTQSLTTSVFTDSLYVLTYPSTDLYSHQPQSHTVLLTYPSAYFNGASKTFDSIDYIGMIFGEPVSTSTFGSNTISYQYFDQFSTASVQTGSFTVWINKEPNPTATGLAFTFPTYPNYLDPLLGQYPNNIYTQMFPWLKSSVLTIISVDTSLWFTEPQSETLTYSCTNSDGSDRPGWIGYNIADGLLRSNLIEPVPSGLLNLKITATDPYEGSYSYYRQMLVDSPPTPSTQFVVFVCSTYKTCSYTVSDIFTDRNGDYLTYSLAQSSQLTELTKAKFDFYTVTQIFTGTPVIIQQLSSIEVTATDPYGLSNNMYVTIRVVQAKPYIRGQANTKLPDQTITEGYLYYFIISKDVIYDTYQGAALLVYAKTDKNYDLPSWIHFNPMSQLFSGKAPAPQQQKIKVTFMNKLTQDTADMFFTLSVIPNNNPVTQVQYLNYDYEIMQFTFFNATLHHLLFRDAESDRFAKIECTGANSQNMTDWITFNELNRSVQGFASVPGHYQLDFTFYDDAGAKTYSNIGITVFPVLPFYLALTAHYFFLVWTLLGMSIYYSYMWLFGLSLYTKTYSEKNADKKAAMDAHRRFKEYEDVEIQFVMPEFMQGEGLECDPVVTYDTDFLGLDRIKMWKERQKRRILRHKKKRRR